jgi:[acyl-carrier-protein] S-malonyltransferase
MHTACLFPGLNAIARDRDRSRYLDVPEVAERIVRLRRRGYDLWLRRPADELYRSGDFTALAALTLAIQAGVYEHLTRRGLRPDLLLGCSLGDVARTVCSGAIAFDDAIDLLAQFQARIGDVTTSGSTCSVRLTAGQQLDGALLAQLRELGLEPSILSNRHCIIGCDSTGAQALQRLARDHGWQVKVAPFPYALHSRHLQPVIDMAITGFAPSFMSPRVPVFSTVQMKILDSAADLFDDARRCFHTPVQWVQSLQMLSQTLGIRRFINIGPCQSLPLLLRETSLDITIENAGTWVQPVKRRRQNEIRHTTQCSEVRIPVATVAEHAAGDLPG